ncbi:MAG: hypothetical protein HZB44_08310 [Actinobacteria bacterium]|nr:hypothetical protein [Actinomycetota bacterium]
MSKILSRMFRPGSAGLISILAVIMLLVAGCGGTAEVKTATSPSTTAQGDYNPQIDPASFVSTVDNQYFPLTPGKTYSYEGEKDGETEINEVRVLTDTRQVMGVTCVVVNDRVSVNGEVVEETQDWFAQDRNGDVWYFGEDSKDFEDGKLKSTKGSWEAGKDGAQPGIIMKATPKAGDSWRQEYYKGVAEDMGEVLAVGEAVKVKAGSYQGCVRTKDWSPLEPKVAENKLYCPGVGVVKTEMVEGGSDSTELVSFL